MSTSHTKSTVSRTGTRQQLLDIATLAQRLAVSERFIRRLVNERRIPYIKVGYFVRFDPRDLDQWVDKARVPPTER